MYQVEPSKWFLGFNLSKLTSSYTCKKAGNLIDYPFHKYSIFWTWHDLFLLVTSVWHYAQLDMICSFINVSSYICYVCLKQIFLSMCRQLMCITVTRDLVETLEIILCTESRFPIPSKPTLYFCHSWRWSWCWLLWRHTWL